MQLPSGDKMESKPKIKAGGWRIFVACLFSAFIVAQAKATTPTITELMASLSAHHPKIMELEAQGLQRQFARDAASAAFDVQLEQDSMVRASGYYDGFMLTQRVVKPLPYGNAKLKAEYRYADGQFPVYEAQYDTLSGGEASLGIGMSLLRDRDIDKKRMAITDAEITVNEWQATQEAIKNQLYYNGIMSYLEWYEAHLALNVYESLVTTTRKRRKAIATRVETGDLAAIALTEFDATVLRRELALQAAKQKAEQTRLKLSFYYRNKQFEPVQTDVLAAVPDDIQWPWNIDQASLQYLQRTLPAHPLLREMRFKQQLAENKVVLAENALLPSLDIEAKLARDLGNGPSSLQQTETQIGLQFSMPLGRRQAKAELGSAAQKVKALTFKYQAVEDALKRDLDIASRNWHYSKKIANMQDDQASLAEALFEQEKKRFNIGASDLFILNSREASAINSRLSAVKAHVDVMRASLEVIFSAGDVSAYLKE